jgi:hypothetical protein
LGTFFIGWSYVDSYHSEALVQEDESQYNILGSCNVTGVTSVSFTCVILKYSLVLVDQAGNVYDDRFAFSNFYSDVCGGTIYEANSTNVSCWYSNVGNAELRVNPITPANSLELVLGTVLLALGASQVVFYIALCCCHCRQARLTRLPATSGHEPYHAGNEMSPLSQQTNQIEELEASTLEQWLSRATSDYARVALRSLYQASLQENLTGFGECPLCVAADMQVVVWWPCGHTMCASCGIAVLRTQRDIGVCPFCRSVANVKDIGFFERPRGRSDEPEVVFEVSAEKT